MSGEPTTFKQFSGSFEFFDYIYNKYIKPCWVWQLVYVISVGLSCAPYEFITIYTLGRPNLRCKMEPAVEKFLQNMTFQEASILLQPEILTKNYPTGHVGCFRQAIPWNDTVQKFINTETFYNYTTHLNDTLYEKCPNGYVTKINPLLFGYTVVDEFALYCDQEWIAVFSVTVFMAGMFIGFYLSGWTGDRFGRRPCMIIYCILETTFGIIYALSPNYKIYLIIRFLLGIITTCKLSLYCLLLFEYSSSKYRVVLTVLSNITYAFIGKGYVALFAYLFDTWRPFIGTLCAITGIGIFCIPLYIESPMWYLSTNKPIEASEALEKAYRFNHWGKKMDTTVAIKLKDFLINYCDKEKKFQALGGDKSSTDTLRLFKDKVLLKKLILGSLLFAFHITVYYGLYLYGGEIKFNIYLVGFINSVSGLPGSLLSLFQMLKMRKRKHSLIINYVIGIIILSGAIAYTLIVQPEFDRVLSICVSVCMCFLEANMVIVYIYIMELFPTSLRSKGFGFTSGFARIGSLLCGSLNNLDRYVLHGVPVVVYIGLLIGAIVVLIAMPDTTGEDIQI